MLLAWLESTVIKAPGGERILSWGQSELRKARSSLRVSSWFVQALLLEGHMNKVQATILSLGVVCNE